MRLPRSSVAPVLVLAAISGVAWQLAVNLLASRPLLANCTPANCPELDLLYGFPIFAVPALVAWRLRERLRERSTWLLATFATGGALSGALNLIFLLRLDGNLAALLSVVLAHPFFTLAPLPVAALILGFAGLFARTATEGRRLQS